MREPCPTWCTGACAFTGTCAGEWSTTRDVGGSGTVRLRRTASGIQVEAGNILTNPITLDMPSARLLYAALGRAVYAPA